MRFGLTKRLGAMLLALSTMGGAALAQSPACNAWRSELASLEGQRGNPRAAQAAQRVGAQLSQTIGQYRAMGCERGGFLFFGEAPPPQCGGMRARINQLQAQFGALQQQAQGGGLEQRRAQLAAMIDNNCRAAPQQRGFFETIFGIEPRRGEIDSTLPELDPEERPAEPTGPRQGGPYTVCVRTCDGYFFPLANSPGGREGQDEMCQALCPGTETTAFGMSTGGDIQNAVQRSTGTPYSSTPNAGKYIRSFDAACTCRSPGQSWVQALRNAEDLLDKRKGDITVTEQSSLEMSRPKPDPKRKTATPAPAPTAQAPTLPDPADDKPMPSENSPTSGTESAGMGPQTVEPEKTVQKGDGVKKETKSVTGEKRTVRIVAPNLAPNLGPSATRP
jgi:hypothetical protein